MDRERRLAFGDVAALYEQMRPSYPEALVDDLIGLAFDGQPPTQPSALEIGAGTGKATVLFARRGVEVLALEPNAEMAAFGQRACAGYNVTFERTDFERWDSNHARFRLLYSAQAWHWIDPDIRYELARAALTQHGLLAAFWNRPDWEACELSEELDAAYRQLAAELLPDGPMRPTAETSPDRWGHWLEEIDGADGLEQAELRTYRWDHEYTSQEYVNLLRTHSDHILLDPKQQQVLYPAIADVIDRHGGTLQITYATRLCLARAL